MILIQRSTIGEAHEEVIRIITERCKGDNRITEDGETTYDPEEPVCIHIDFPFNKPMKSSASLFGDRFSEHYQASLYTITKRKNDGTDATYTYRNRLRDYPVASLRLENPVRNTMQKIFDTLLNPFGYVPAGSIAAIAYAGDGNLGGIDQIQRSIIDRLIESPNSRRAVAITWSPFHDSTRKEPPCLQIVQGIIDSSDHLNLVCLFRSNDMLSAWGQNAFGLAHMQSFILDEINKSRKERKQDLLTIGWLETISISAHMYFTRDQLELMKFNQKDQVKDSFRIFHNT